MQEIGTTVLKKRKIRNGFGQGENLNQLIERLVGRLDESLDGERSQSDKLIEQNDQPLRPLKLDQKRHLLGSGNDLGNSEEIADNVSQRKKVVHRLIRDYNEDYFIRGLSQVSRKFRMSIVQLHYLFPHVLMPAIEMLECQKVTLFSLISPEGELEQQIWRVGNKLSKGACSRKASDEKSYRVDLAQWNCGCTEFLCAAFARQTNSGNSDSDTDEDRERKGEEIKSENKEKRDVYSIGFGGTGYIRKLRHDRRPAVCRHIMACYLGERAGPLFARLVTRTTLEGQNPQDLQRWIALFH
ncbi:hypothetical protein NADFUDRAFT_40340 [Nadsonia fulvescens var. elongata DSM 6958]|uniref:SWIM-type domain-containing protein n=1 Tax=Nadsonia fulvescens var. elongata DSM 6958 TaxID=857566 RepID=A0A1E3PP12_9ASCO|nr:hypothetical protein NADFUDRAFT_40340 [Nadsonia fulvescens var. elongata DSM 6958]